MLLKLPLLILLYLLMISTFICPALVLLFFRKLSTLNYVKVTTGLEPRKFFLITIRLILCYYSQKHNPTSFEVTVNNLETAACGVLSKLQHYTTQPVLKVVNNQCCHFWYFDIRSNILKKNSDVWCFGEKSDLDKCWQFKFSTFPLHLGWKEVSFIIFKFLSSVSHPHVCLVIVPKWRSSLRCVAMIYYIMHGRRLRTKTTLISTGQVFFY